MFALHLRCCVKALLGSVEGLFYVGLLVLLSQGTFALLGLQLWSGLLQGGCGWPAAAAAAAGANASAFFLPASDSATPIFSQAPCPLPCHAPPTHGLSTKEVHKFVTLHTILVWRRIAVPASRTLFQIFTFTCPNAQQHQCRMSNVICMLLAKYSAGRALITFRYFRIIRHDIEAANYVTT